MPELQLIGSTTTGTMPSRANTGPTGSDRRRPNLSRIFSAQYLDDHSVYHHDNEAASDDDTDTDVSEELTQEENEETRKDWLKRDLEAGGAPLEKKKTSRSVKDPNLVGMLEGLAGCEVRSRALIRVPRSNGTGPLIPRIQRTGLASKDGQLLLLFLHLRLFPQSRRLW